jgi:dTDP-4-dehydrorhamnose reductase
VKVLILGAGGQLGRALQEALPPGSSAVALTREHCDITHRDTVRAALDRHRPDHVFNAAAYTAVDRAETEPEIAAAVNARAVGDLADACREFGSRLVHVSTDFVFDGRRGHPYAPHDTPAPLNCYGRTKLAGELAARASPTALVVRTSWLYGAQGGNFVHTMLALMAERNEVRVVCDQVGTPTHTVSAAKTIWELAYRGATGIFHATDAGVASWYDFAVAIQEEALQLELLPRRIPIVPIAATDYPAPARRPSFSVLDKAATWSLLGTPSPHWRCELRAMLAQVRAVNLG